MTQTLAQEQNTIRTQTRSDGRRLARSAAVVFILIVYSYPALRTRADLGALSLPPEFSPDLSLYLNLSNLVTVAPGQVANPYYFVPVPANGSAYLKFRLGSVLFSVWNRVLAGKMWLAMLLWNLFWWGLLCALALSLFDRFLPRTCTRHRDCGSGLADAG